MLSTFYPHDFAADTVCCFSHPRDCFSDGELVTCLSTAASRLPEQNTRVLPSQKYAQIKVAPCLHINLAFMMHDPCSENQDRGAKRGKLGAATARGWTVLFSLSLRIFEGNTVDGRYRFPI